MSKDTMEAIDYDGMVSGFKDEDTEVWIQGSISLGKSAQAGDPQAIDFIATMLAHPTNIHYRRHAMCCLASYLSAGIEKLGPDFRPVFDRIYIGEKQKVQQIGDVLDWVREWLLGLILRDLQDKGARVSDVDQAKYPFWKDQALAIRKAVEAKILEMEQKGIQPAVDALRKDLEIAGNPDTPLADIKYLQVRTPIEDSGGWVFSSFMAGLSPVLLDYFGIRAESLFESAIAQAKRGNVGYIANVPRFLSRFEEPIHELSWVGDMMDSVWQGGGAWGNKADFLRQLIGLVGHFPSHLAAEDAQTSTLFLHAQTPPSLRTAITAYLDSIGSPEDSLEDIEHHQLHAVRVCAEFLQDQLRWHETPPAAQTSIAWLLFLMTEFPRVEERRRTLDLNHRIAMTVDFIDAAKRDNHDLLVPLVRLLKILFNMQLVEVVSRHKGRMGQESGPAVFKVCQRQIQTIMPILDGWGLRGTIYKDMATITARTLDAVYAATPEEGQDCLPHYFRLLYSVLYALPEPGFQRELLSYAKAEPIKKDLAFIANMAGANHVPPDMSGRMLDGKPCFDPPAGFCDEFPARGPNTSSLIRFLTGPVPDISGFPKLLKDLVAIRQQLVIVRDLGHIHDITEALNQEIAESVEVRTNSIVTEILALVNDTNDQMEAIRLGLLEPGAIQKTLRAVHNNTLRLQVLCRDNLPMLERIAVNSLLAKRLDLLKQHMDELAEIIDRENEGLATQLIRSGRSAYRNLVSRWMYDRYMLTELSGNSRTLQFFLSPYSLAIFAVFVFGASIIANRLTGATQVSNSTWTAAPFLMGLVLVPVFGFTIKSALQKQKNHGFLKLSSFLMPQVLATLFLGVMQNLGSDEGWAGAFMKSPDARLLGILFWSGAAYYFVRKVMLGDQEPTGIPSPSRTLRSRASGIMTLGLWQAFFLLLLFTMLMGPSMAGTGRANLVGAAELLPPLAKTAGTYLPNVIDVYLGTYHLMIFPWALLSWTFSLFFFGAVFEQIMRRQ